MYIEGTQYIHKRAKVKTHGEDPHTKYQRHLSTRDLRLTPVPLVGDRTRPMLPHTTSAVSAFPVDDVRSSHSVCV